MRRLASFVLLSSLTSTVMALNVNGLWDYSKPELSEQRFIAALDGASEDEKLLLQTQIARTYGLHRNFSKAQEVLSSVEPEIQSASLEVQARYFLELGRTYASTMHPEDSRTPENLEAARSNFLYAHEIAARARLDFLAIDALHMMPCVDSEPDRQLEWNEKAVAYMERSDQPDAKGWEGSLRNNIGHARMFSRNWNTCTVRLATSHAPGNTAASSWRLRSDA